MCNYPDCQARARYNVAGEKPLYCKEHKLDGMTYFRFNTCANLTCYTQPHYNFIGQKPMYCMSHKLYGMIDVVNKKCAYSNCVVQPSFNIAGETQSLYCSAHKLENMVNIKNKLCSYLNCNTTPSYNFAGKKPLYCVKHKLSEMIHIKSKMCIYPNCNIRPSYNIPSECVALYCTEHKLSGMIDVVSKLCIHAHCNVRPTFNFIGKKQGLYCAKHKLDNMVDVVSKSCKNEWCFTTVSNKYDGYCAYCYVHMFPDKPVSRNYKTKEFAVAEFIKITFPDFDWKTDRKISDGCSKRRPDLLLDLGYQVVIIEIDENQHIDYDCSCENKRIMELSLDVGHRPIVFIRFNPDEYKTNGTNITSCWGVNKSGLCNVKKTKMKEWNARLNCLQDTVAYWTNPENITSKTVEIINLFYDEA